MVIPAGGGGVGQSLRDCIQTLAAHRLFDQIHRALEIPAPRRRLNRPECGVRAIDKAAESLEQLRWSSGSNAIPMRASASLKRKRIGAFAVGSDPASAYPSAASAPHRSTISCAAKFIAASTRAGSTCRSNRWLDSL